MCEERGIKGDLLWEKQANMESIICVDLRSFDRAVEDLGVNAYFKQLGFVPTGLCFLNFQVMYLFDFENVDDRELDPYMHRAEREHHAARYGQIEISIV